MITGIVTEDGVPIIKVEIAGVQWPAIVDTGFNGDLELPEELRGKLNDEPIGRVRSALAGGQVIEEDAYTVQFPFDGDMIECITTFVADTHVLIGTNLMREYSLQLKFASKTLLLDRE